MHLTLRAGRGLPSLRSDRVFDGIREALGAARASATGLRVVHSSVQADHLHLLVEAPDRESLCRGAKGLAVRLSRSINKTLGRSGRVWGDRGLDPRSSAAVFDGWERAVPPPPDAPALPAARTWLLTTGWRRHGLLRFTEAPAPPARA